MRLPGWASRGTVLLIWLALFSGAASADTMFLTNGRKVEGKVVRTDDDAITWQVEGGTIDVPREEVDHVVPGSTPEDDYADRLMATDMDDPEAIENLAEWADEHGLESRSRDLRELARGVRLDHRFEQARNANTAKAFVDLEAWASLQGYPLDVRALALEKAARLAPHDRGVAGRWHDLRDRARAQHEREDAADRARAQEPPDDAPPAKHRVQVTRAATEDDGVELDPDPGHRKLDGPATH